MQLGRCDVDGDVSEPLEGGGVQRLRHRALNRVIHQLVLLIVHDLVRRGVGRRAAALSIVMSNLLPFPGVAHLLLILVRPVETGGDG